MHTWSNEGKAPGWAAVSREVMGWKGDIPDSRKCLLGKGTRFVVISFRSTFRGPSKRMGTVRCSNSWAARLFIPSNGRPEEGPFPAYLHAPIGEPSRYLCNEHTSFQFPSDMLHFLFMVVISGGESGPASSEYVTGA